MAAESICPYCQESVRSNALICKHCHSQLVPSLEPSSKDKGSTNVTYVVDRGVLYFGKFVLGAVAILTTIGILLLGIDAKRIRDDFDGRLNDMKALKEQLDGVHAERMKELEAHRARLAKSDAEVASLAAAIPNHLDRIQITLDKMELANQEIARERDKIVEIRSEIDETAANAKSDLEQIRALRKGAEKAAALWVNEFGEKLSISLSSLDRRAEIVEEEQGDPFAPGIPSRLDELMERSLQKRSESSFYSKWWGAKPRTLRVSFLGGTEEARNKTMELAQEWAKHCSIAIERAEEGIVAELRVSFQQDTGQWSFVGTDNLAIAPSAATMNNPYPDVESDEFKNGTLRNFGHVLAVPSPESAANATIPWDEPKAREYFLSRGMTRQRIDELLSPDDLPVREYDPDSVMHLPIPNEITIGDFEVPLPTKLSDGDIAFVGRVYPKPSATAEEP